MRKREKPHKILAMTKRSFCCHFKAFKPKMKMKVFMHKMSKLASSGHTNFFTWKAHIAVAGA